jgi:hypothetical protein
VALVLGLAFAAGPIAGPAHAECAELTLYVTWEGTDPTGQSTTPVHEGCITEAPVVDGNVAIGDHFDGPVPSGLPNGFYVYVSVPIP